MDKDMIQRVRDFREALDTVDTVEDLAQWAEDLYASGLLDESEQVEVLDDPDLGWLSPWTPPFWAEILDDDGENLVIYWEACVNTRDPWVSQHARWDNHKREWERVAPRYPVAVVEAYDDELEEAEELKPVETLDEAMAAVEDAGYTILRDGAQHETTDAWDQRRGTMHVVNVLPVEEEA